MKKKENKKQMIIELIFGLLIVASIIILLIGQGNTNNRLDKIEGFQLGKNLTEECQGDQTNIGSLEGCTTYDVLFIDQINRQYD